MFAEKIPQKLLVKSLVLRKLQDLQDYEPQPLKDFA